ncbi:MAG: bacterio-opsin activator domain-containing protein [Haloarculaceae archaeon]
MADTGHLRGDTGVLVAGSATWLDAFTEALEARTGASARAVETAAAALDVVRRDSADCLVTEHAVDGTTGVELARRVRETDPTLPVVLATATGSEAVASEAVEAGVADYVPIPAPEDPPTDELIERVDRALRSARRSVTRRERARQFDAVFRGAQTATWVLDSDGSLRRANRTAREMVDADVDAVVGDPFWTLPWWASAATRRDVRRLVEKARDGRFGNAVVFGPPGEARRVVDLSVRPVENERGELASIVVEGIDTTEQVRLERDLRESEELHRVTLNNMTDTVLITDEDGEYTYVCPNVHFIFGYTAEEIRDRGTIDELLGKDLFDRERLAERGVLKNIECTVTDKAGREHTLLVNVREVSIRDGTLLYSCRDITKRKQREEALAALQETAREFLYAGTHQEIAEHVVDDASSVLDLSASAVYLFDDAANELRPAARSRAMAERHGPLATVHADGETLLGHCFVDDETLVFDDVHAADRLANRATDLRGGMYIPLGNHGVFVAGSTDVGAFDGVKRELADLLAASAEAALDRVTREARLREQDRELQRRNEQLVALNRINDTIREIHQAVVRAETREEIDHAVCERLTDTDRFAFAWVGRVDPASGTVEPRARAGDEQGYLDGQSVPVDASGVEPAGRTAATGEVTVVETVATGLRESPWRPEALARDFLSVMSIPLVYNDFEHGVLTVYADAKAAFDDTTRAVLGELGETVASALSAVERKRALLTTSVTRVEFAVEDETFLLSRLARTAECSLRYEAGGQHGPDGDSVFVTVEDADVGTVAEAAADTPGVEDVTRISRTGTDEGVLRLRLSRPFPALELADHGAIFREATADPTATTLVVDVPESIDVRNVARLVRETFSSAELRRKETAERGTHGRHTGFLSDLTDRQLEVVQTAYYSGYFESPRENDGADVAETLDISPTAFYQHVRAVQRKLFATAFEGSAEPGGTSDRGV